MKIGIIGAGQLAQMLAISAVPLGMKVHCLAQSMSDCAEPVADLYLLQPDDEEGLQAFAESVDIITFENENIAIGLVETLNEFCPIFPSITALSTAQDRLYEKKALREQDIPTADFHEVNSLEELKHGVALIGKPCILKTRRFGYDGKGQMIIRQDEDVQKAWDLLGNSPLILEQFIDFEFETSIVAVRNGRGDFAYYPIACNTHRNAILRQTAVPLAKPELQHQAEHYAKTMMDQLNYVGVMTIEFFVKENELIANEIAPRVHNTGHWTIEGAACSQFENHIRAICNLHLGSTQLVAPTTTFNIIGETPKLDELLSIENAHVHLYGKSPRNGRKLGHVTLVENNKQTYQKDCDKVFALLNEKVNA